MKLYQQGDVLIVQVKEIPGNAKQAPSGPVVLAEGEVTGHRHVVDSPFCTAFMTGTDSLFLALSQPCTVVHEEHHAVTIPEGTWEVKKVQEYDHFKEEAKNVKD